jgi:imidazolonepropionase-like amidohydrolase
MTAIAITNARLIDGTGAEPLDGATLLVRDDTIDAVGPDVDVPDDARIVDAEGMTLLPGLIDTHQHAMWRFRAMRRMQDCLRRGTTTVADVTAGPDGPELREAIENDTVQGAARYHVGMVVGCTFGHLHREDDNVAGVDADGPWEVRRGVRQMVQAGADFIKTAASGGFYSKNEVCALRNYTLEELVALVDEAHAWHRPVVVHCHTQPGLNNCIEAGVDQIHHGGFIDEEAVRGILAADLWYMPTLSVTCPRNIEALSDQPWQTIEMAQAQPIHRAGVRLAHEIGVKLCVGTDYPGTGKTWKLGDRTIWELMELEACGLSRMEALLAATKTNAEAYRLDHLGTLEPGKIADVVLLDGDPLAGFEALYDHRNVKLVLRDGRVEFADGELLRHYSLHEPQPSDRPPYED